MTIEQIDRYLRICRSATPGPWFDQTSNSRRRLGHNGDGDVAHCAAYSSKDGTPTLDIKDDDMAFILAAREGFQEALEALKNLGGGNG